mgnify:CR=1 FL=1
MVEYSNQTTYLISSNLRIKDINEYVLGINNTNVFTDKKYVESLCLSPLQAKLFLMKNNLWKNFNV